MITRTTAIAAVFAIATGLTTAGAQMLPTNLKGVVSLQIAAQGPTATNRVTRRVLIKTNRRNINTKEFLDIIAKDHGFTNGYPAGSTLMLQNLQFLVVRGTNVVDTLQDAFNFDNFDFNGAIEEGMYSLANQAGSVSYQFVGDMQIQTASNSGLMHSLITIDLKLTPTRYMDGKLPILKLWVSITVKGFGQGHLFGEDVIMTDGSTISFTGTSYIAGSEAAASLRAPHEAAVAMKSARTLTSVLRGVSQWRSVIP